MSGAYRIVEISFNGHWSDPRWGSLEVAFDPEALDFYCQIGETRHEVFPVPGLTRRGKTFTQCGIRDDWEMNGLIPAASRHYGRESDGILVCVLAPGQEVQFGPKKADDDDDCHAQLIGGRRLQCRGSFSGGALFYVSSISYLLHLRCAKQTREYSWEDGQLR